MTIRMLQRASCSRGHCDTIDAGGRLVLLSVTEDIMLERALRLAIYLTTSVCVMSYRGHHAREGIATGRVWQRAESIKRLQRTSCSRGHCDYRCSNLACLRRTRLQRTECSRGHCD